MNDLKTDARLKLKHRRASSNLPALFRELKGAVFGGLCCADHKHRKAFITVGCTQAQTKGNISTAVAAATNANPNAFVFKAEADASTGAGRASPAGGVKSAGVTCKAMEGGSRAF